VSTAAPFVLLNQRLRLPTVSPTGPGMPAPVITSGSQAGGSAQLSTVHTCAGDASWIMIVWTLLFTQAPRHVPHECHPLGIISPCRHVPHLGWRHSSSDRVGQVHEQTAACMSGFVLSLVCLCDVCTFGVPMRLRLCISSERIEHVRHACNCKMS
jgi:hypothetical protein